MGYDGFCHLWVHTNPEAHVSDNRDGLMTITDSGDIYIDSDTTMAIVAETGIEDADYTEVLHAALNTVAPEWRHVVEQALAESEA